MSDSYNFREATRVMREHALNVIKAQQDATDYTLRKRIYQTQKGRNEMEWQKLKVYMINYISSILINFHENKNKSNNEFDKYQISNGKNLLSSAFFNINRYRKKWKCWEMR